MKETWISPNGKYKNMIDYIMVRRRDRDECYDSRSLVSADCDSDHQLVWAKLKGRTWNKKRHTKTKPKRDFKVLKVETTKREFENKLSVRTRGAQCFAFVSLASERAAAIEILF